MERQLQRRDHDLLDVGTGVAVRRGHQGIRK
jgi:hypothetical protein